MDDRPHVVKQLVTLRRQSKVTQVELAAEIGTSQPAISDLERGKTSPSLRLLRRYAQHFGMEVTLAPAVPAIPEGSDHAR